MPTSQYSSPALLPILSRGKHRSPRKGACFMEMASFLAGERWSDHPRCTHPLLAGVARLVNDQTTDEGRPSLAPLIPSVIGLTSTDPRVDVDIALRCARTAIPVVSAGWQKVMAVTVLTADRLLALMEGRPLDHLAEESHVALESAPAAAQWAYRFTLRSSLSVDRFRRSGAPNAVRCAVEGIADACIDDPDAMLRDLLLDAIAVTRTLAAGGDSGVGPFEVDDESWRAACRLQVR